jgi:tetratricopeptide (TPR) repeat protein
MHDARGQPIAAAGPETVRRLDAAIDAYLGARADTIARLDEVLDHDPGCILAHCLDGYVHMVSSRREGIARAREALARAMALARDSAVPPREALHIGALEAWSQGDMRGAAAHWQSLLGHYPRDVIALRVSQFVLSYLGDAARMRETVERVLPAWDDGVPGYGFVLGCHAYALEESGEYARAEGVGRRAVELNPSDIWAAHAVAHVREMQGRLRDGIDWISTLTGEWRECGGFARHLRWHEGLYWLDLEEHDRVLELYDREVRPEPTDEYLDIANAVSLLWRLEQVEVDVGVRWRELAERSSARAEDHALVFVDLHRLMALAAAGDDGAAGRALESCERFARGEGTESEVMASVGLPLARGVLAHRRGAYGEVVDLLLPVRQRIRLIGGSNAQRDVFEQLLIDAAWRGRRLDVAASLLTERTARRPGNRWGWKHLAAVLDESGAPGVPRADAARRELVRLRAL